LWFAYLQGLRQASVGSGGADVPLIRADERPTKVKPEKPGGMEIPDRDKVIYTQKPAAVEHLLPPPEKPMPRPTAPPAGPQPKSVSPAGAASTAAPTTAPPAKPQPPTSPTAQPTPARTGGSRIQLGSVRSEEAARHEWERIKRSNSDLLGGLSATPVRADLPDKGVFFRIMAGPVADAGQICRELNRRNVGCIIVR
jgi:cell division septation protein DedD